MKFSEFKLSLKEANAEEKVISVEKIGKKKNVEAKITKFGDVFRVYINGEHIPGRDYSTLEKAKQDIRDYERMIESNNSVIQNLLSINELNGSIVINFDNNKKMEVDPLSAMIVSKLYKGLNEQAQEKIEKFIQKSPDNFNKILVFATQKIKV